MSEPEILDQTLQRLIGERLSSVEFVQDYLQLRFDGPCLTVYIPSHQVTRKGKSSSCGELDYRNALSGLIACVVKSAEVIESKRLSLTFEDDSVWSMSLRQEDYRGPEALMFTDCESRFFVM